jgi:hypothetical protein
MLWHLIELRTSQPHIYDHDSSIDAMIDWASAGLYDGFRLSKWAQPNGHCALHNPHLNIRGVACAFLKTISGYCPMIRSVSLLTKSSNLILLAFLSAKSLSSTVPRKIGWHGKELQHTCNTSTMALCHVASSMRIVPRFARLVGRKHRIPLCVYCHDNGTICYITASIIKSTFRMAMAHVYKLDPITDSAHLCRWSAHSLRVGACVILHGMVFTGTQIQFLLRC